MQKGANLMNVKYIVSTLFWGGVFISYVSD